MRQLPAYLLLTCTAVGIVILTAVQAGAGPAIVMAVLVVGLASLAIWSRVTQAKNERGDQERSPRA